ncbi:acetate kinase [Striga asiatica]|uniref:Acetate kinase n=1 Tax=Striga asiatica TaxID=4170 RepID=A0A5A7PVL3_STRAF|nr:acetate kinase [Striga asiatica]
MKKRPIYCLHNRLDSTRSCELDYSVCHWMTRFAFYARDPVINITHKKNEFKSISSSSKDLKSVTTNSPLVIVPVLSKAIIFIRARVSRCSAPLKSTPKVAAFDKAQNIATGVERRRAHGHPLTKTTSAKWNHSFLFFTRKTKGTMAKKTDTKTITYDNSVRVTY